MIGIQSYHRWRRQLSISLQAHSQMCRCAFADGFACPRLRTHPQTHACMCISVRMSAKVSVCVHGRVEGNVFIRMSAALPVHTIAYNRFLITLPGERREGREEQLAVTPVPRTLRGPVWQLKLDACALSASSNSYESLPLCECYKLTFTLNSGLFLSLLGNWQADQFTCIIRILTFREVIMVKIVRIVI